MNPWQYKGIIAERMKRQGLAEPLGDSKDEEAYIDLFRYLQPVAPPHFTRPGDPPKLVHRTQYDATEMASSLRERHSLVKGRYLGGRVGYVFEDDLKLYGTAFRKVITRFNRVHEDVLSAIREAGGLTKEQLKEELDYPAAHIGKALQDLQCAFILQEDQIDTDWETGWLDFAEEWFEIPKDPASQVEAQMKVILRFIGSMVFATEGQIKSWCNLPSKTIKELVRRLVEAERLVCIEIEGLGQGLMLEKDVAVGDFHYRECSRSIHMLDPSDFLVRAYLEELKSRYKGLEVLQYLLVDGEFQGAVLGHWRIGPYDVDDVILDLDATEAVSRQDEVITAIRKIYDPESCAILRYNGVEINQ
ncbi:DNA glycosylase AlkZ-like family protein [Paenibacillus segetis]|uniref:Winged helix DNA-binding domain-containing protein n=1 Tax=Paenibacillus segetis TaxID=1325360 RepID=A0ABQ1Y832_9BACL|nr:crosslink repair DNA glycosylase YcaQ family protein [Paenibacillus segetis]GGH15788.1 hypothetical protein GCM10008013_10200 [Paenibacillus segetis]